MLSGCPDEAMRVNSQRRKESLIKIYTDYSSECLPLLFAHCSSLRQESLFRQINQLRLLIPSFGVDEVVFRPRSKAHVCLAPNFYPSLCGFAVPIPGLPARAGTHLVAVGVLLLVLLNQPVLDGGGGLAGSGGFLSLDLDGHALVLLQRGGQVGLLGGLWGLGLVEGQDLALGVVGLECWCLVGLELFQVELLDEVGCEDAAVLVSMRLGMISKGRMGRRDR